MNGEPFYDIRLSEALAERGIAAVLFDSVDSTNSAARRYAADGGAVPALFAARTQSAGRGRMGRSFYSPAKTGIYATLLIDITDDASSTAIGLTSAAAVAVARVIERYTGLRGEIKWVNDILLDGKKVCGILAESFCAGEKRLAAVGVGINISTSVFPPELEGMAGSLRLEDAEALIPTMTAAVGCELYDVYSELRGGNGHVMEEYRRRSAVLGRRVTFSRNGVSEGGTAVGIRDDGALEVVLDNGEHRLLSSGEISLRMKS